MSPKKSQKSKFRTIPYADHIGQKTSPWSKLAKFESAIVIGFRFDDPQKAALDKIGVVVLSIEEALSSGTLDADYIGIHIPINEIEKAGIKRMVKRSGTITLSSNEASLVAMLTSRRSEEEGAP